MSLLSGLTTAAIAIPNIPVVQPTPAPKPSTFSGAVVGAFDSQDRIPDIGRTWTLHASGKLAGLGRTTVSGTLAGTGFTVIGHAGGTLTLTNPHHGKMTLTLSGPTQGGFSGLPSQFSFVVTQAGGRDHKHLGETGTVDVALSPAPGRANSAFGEATGTVSLRFSPGPIVAMTL